MATLACPECEMTQAVTVTVDTYVVVSEHCGHQFEIPREHRINKREVQEYTSRVNIRVGWRDAGELTQEWKASPSPNCCAPFNSLRLTHDY